MTVDLKRVIDQSTPLLGPDRAAPPGPQEKKPLHLGDNGRLEVREPRGSPPGLWTRFKAALINVPLIGRLQCVQVAGEEVRIVRLQAQFRDDFHHALADRYGRDVAHGAVAGKSAGAAQKPLTARRIEKITRKAQSQARRCGQLNGAEIARQLPYPGQKLAVVLADMCAMMNPEYFRRPLQASEIRTAYSATATMLEELQRHGLDLDAVRPELQEFDAELSNKPIDEYQAIAARYLPRIIGRCHEACNRAILERSFPEDVASSSSSPRGPYLGKTDAPLVALLCAQALGPDAPILPEAAAHQAWRDLADVRRTLRQELPDVPAGRIDAVLTKVTEGFTALTGETLLALARKEILISEMKRQFDPRDRQSLFWNAVIEAAGEHQTAKRHSGSPFDGNPNLTALLTALSKDVLTDLDYRAPHIPGDPSLSTVLPQMRRQLIDHVKQATKEHLEALDLIESSNTLNAMQKQKLREYVSPPEAADEPEGARPQRLDEVQLHRYEAIANTIAERLPMMKAALQRGEPALLHDCTAQIVEAFREGYGDILAHAENMWLARSFNGTGAEERVFELCVKLALDKHFAPPIPRSPRPATRGRSASSSRSSSRERAGSVRHDQGRSGSPMPTPRRPSSLRTGTSELVTPRPGGSEVVEPADDFEAEAFADAPSSAPDEEGYAGFADAESQFLHACAQSPSTAIAKLGMFYGDILRISGDETFNVEEEEPEPLHHMRPEMLVRTLTDPSCTMDGGGALDARGVYANGRFRNLVARSYDPAAVFNPARHSAQPAAAPAPAQVKDVLERADIILLGRRLSLDPTAEEPARGAMEAFNAAVAAEADGMVAGVASCLSSDALQNFSRDIARAAFDPPVNIAYQPDVHEVWRDTDGSWLVRSTRVGRPLSQGGQPLDTNGVVLCALTHRITRAAAADGSGPPFQVQLLGNDPTAAADDPAASPRPTAVIMLTEPRRAPPD